MKKYKKTNTKDFLDDIEKNIKNKEDLEYVKKDSQLSRSSIR